MGMTTLPTTVAAFARLFDHTALKPEVTRDQIRKLCAEAKELGTAGVCVNPWHVALAAKELSGTPQVTMAVVGFPLGANRTDIKIDEALRAVGDGAGELDMVINVGAYLGGDKAAARHDIAAVVEAVAGTPVKVIIETALLKPEHVTELSEWCIAAGAAFVKTSTGFSTRGASVEDIQLMAAAAQKHAKPGKPQIGIKASGGIKTLEQAMAMLKAGATRVGASATVDMVAAFKATL
jgi:deoxyribose-phosphate aldolase